MRTQSAAGLALALVAAATFGTSGSFARSLTDAGWTSGAAVVARIGVAAVVLAIPGLLALRGNWHLLGQNATLLITYGIVGVAGIQVCFFYAIQRLSVGVALLLEFLGIFLVVGWSWLVRRQPPTRYTAAGSVLAVAGLLLVLDLTGTAAIDPIGVLYGLGAAIGLGCHFIIASRAGDSVLPPLTFAGAGMAVGTVALVALGAIGALPMAATFTDVEFAGGSASWLVPVAGLAIVAAVVSYVTGVGAARLLGARVASFVGLTEVLFAVLIAWALLDELPTAIQLAGGVLIIAGVALVRADPAESRTDDAEQGGGTPSTRDHPVIAG